MVWMEKWERKRVERIDAMLQFVHLNEGVNQDVLIASLFIRWGMSPKVTAQYLNQLELARVIDIKDKNVFLSEKRKEMMLMFEEAKKEASPSAAPSVELSSKERVSVEASAEVDHFFENVGVPVE